MSPETSRTPLLLLLCVASAYAAFVPPTRLDVPVILSSGGRPMLGVGMGTAGVGSIQNFNFTLSTSTGYSSVANNGCSGCSSEATYDQSKSPDSRTLNGQSALSLGAGNFSGTIVKENCSLATTVDGTSWPYTNQTIVLMNSQSGATPFGNGISGIFGLGTLKQGSSSGGFNATFDDSIYGQYYIRNPTAQSSGYNFTFGMDLKPSPVIPGNGSSLTLRSDQQSLVDQNVGTFHWLQPDESVFQTDKMQTVPINTGITSGYLKNNEQPDLTVELDGWSVRSGNQITSVANIMSNIDPYYSGIYMPNDKAQSYHNAISGAQGVSLSTIEGETTSWQVPCDTTVQFTVSINGQQFTVDESILIAKMSDNTCISIVEGFTDSSVTQYIFGQTWISQLYIVFNIPQNGNPTLIFAPRTVSSTRSRDVGAIVGGVVGGVAGVIALGLLGFYLIRRRQDSSLISHITALDEEHKNASNIAPYTFGVPGAPSSVAPSSAFGAFASPPISPHAPLLEHDAVHGAAPPTYEEASEAGGSAAPSSPRAFPPEKAGYARRADTMFSDGQPSPDRSMFSASASSRV